MPTINIKKNVLMQKLGKEYTDEEFDELCFKFGIELDEITSEKKMALKDNAATGKESDDVIYKIDIPANRYDLLCCEGIALALGIFNGTMRYPKPLDTPLSAKWKDFTKLRPEWLKWDFDYAIAPNNGCFMVAQEVEKVRPCIVAAAVWNLKFDEHSYNSLIDLQDKLHQNIGRKRSMVSIGTHDLDTVHPPFFYFAQQPSNLSFVPLNQTKAYSALEMMDLYADSYLKPYLHLVKGKPLYPVVTDYERKVLSMPPIINGDLSKVTLNTRNILVEITGTDLQKCKIALHSMVSMLLMCADPSPESKPVLQKFDVTYTMQDSSYCTPDMSFHTELVCPTYINQGLGVNLQVDEIIELLKKMGHHAELNGTEQPEMLKVNIPPTRQDVIHKCDIMEDVGIAYGYDNIKKTLPNIVTIATQVPLNKFSDQLRNEIARCGYTEALNFALCSEDELGRMLRKSDTSSDMIIIQNPKTIEFQVARTCLLPGLLKTINSNKKMPLPMKLFEIGDVVIADSTKDVGSRNVRYLAAVYYGKHTSGFEIIHGLLGRIMQVLDVAYIGDQSDRATGKNGYYIEASADVGIYLPGRSATVIYNGETIGYLGTLHPEVLTNFVLNHPASALEITIEKFPFVSDKK